MTMIKIVSMKQELQQEHYLIPGTKEQTDNSQAEAKSDAPSAALRHKRMNKVKHL